MNTYCWLTFVSIILFIDQVASTEKSLQNDCISLTFNEANGEFLELIDKSSSINLLGSAVGSVPVLTFTLVDAEGPIEVDVGGRPSSVEASSKSSALLSWKNIDVRRDDIIATIDVFLQIELPSETSTVSEWSVSMALTNSTGGIGLWEVAVSIPSDIASDETGELFFPSGFGKIYDNPVISTSGSKAADYPSSGGSMQYLAVGNTESPSGLYVAALDANSHSKQLQYAVRRTPGTAGESSATAASSRQLHGAHVFTERGSHHLKYDNKANHGIIDARELNWVEERAAPPVGVAGKLSKAATALTIIIVPENAGQAIIGTWVSPFKIAVGVLQNIDASRGRPLWVQAAAMYREWALSKALWTAQGPISDPRRSDQFPDWYLATNVWINSHWQCHDIFNATGGDPSFVLPYTLAIAKRLGEERLALHWYEWQQGPDPSPEGRYLFDTHYPDYFPSRTNFAQAVRELSDNNIATFPYINGRISDVNSDAYINDDGLKYCTKAAPIMLVDDSTADNLEAYEETYGSNATFCVTNPFTPYWQGKLADTCERLVAEANVAGVYIDQIGSAGPKMCWDATHDHTLGGGSYWTEGYQGMLDSIAKQLGTVTTQPRPIVTEDNAEPYMSMLQGYLTLNAYKGSLAQQVQSEDALRNAQHMVPAFNMVYGGYYVGFGAIWTRADFEDHDWWCSKLASMFTTGSQMGWFSLAGMVDDTEDSCGPMGVGDLFLSVDNDDLVSFMQTLSAARTAALDYFVHGHIVSPAGLAPIPTVKHYTSSYTHDTSDYDTVVVQSFVLEESKSVLIALVGATEYEYIGNIQLHLTNWIRYFENGSESTKLDIFQRTFSAKLRKDDSSFLGGEGLHRILQLEVENGATLDRTISVPVTVPARSVVLIELTAHA